MHMVQYIARQYSEDLSYERQSAAQREIFVRNGLDGEFDFEVLDFGAGEAVLLFMKERQHQGVFADQLFGLLINIVAELRMCFLASSFDEEWFVRIAAARRRF